MAVIYILTLVNWFLVTYKINVIFHNKELTQCTCTPILYQMHSKLSHASNIYFQVLIIVQYLFDTLQINQSHWQALI